MPLTASNGELADFLIERLNALIEDDAIRVDVSNLIGTRVVCSAATESHPSIQVDGRGDDPTLGFLGLLNGMIGTVSAGERAGWGLISAECDDDGRVIRRFVRTR